MKHRSNLCTRIFTALALSVTILVTAVPVSAGEIPENNDLSMLTDNNIPVVYITVDNSAEGFSTFEEVNESENHSAKCTGTVRIDVPDGYKGDYSDTVLEDTEELQLAYMRGRGNVTWGFADKKPYKIKFDKKQDILGMGKNKHWALLANRFDGSMLRNRLAMYIASRLGMEYTPKMLPVDLVIDGKYMGSYYLSELVRIGKNRVDIDELTPDDNEEPNITGGYLLAIEPAWSTKPAHPENTVTTSRNESFSFESPEFYSEDEDDVLGTEQQKEYIENYLKETEEAIFGQDFKNSDGVSYTEYLDAQSAADFWWLQEFTINRDAVTTSSNYLYKKRDGKLYF